MATTKFRIVTKSGNKQTASKKTKKQINKAKYERRMNRINKPVIDTTMPTKEDISNAYKDIYIGGINKLEDKYKVKMEEAKTAAEFDFKVAFENAVESGDYQNTITDLNRFAKKAATEHYFVHSSNQVKELKKTYKEFFGKDLDISNVDLKLDKNNNFKNTLSDLWKKYISEKTGYSEEQIKNMSKLELLSLQNDWENKYGENLSKLFNIEWMSHIYGSP